MADIQIISSNGENTTLTDAQVSAFKSGFNGNVLVHGDDGYEEARTIWNAMIDRRPALVAQPTSPEGVIAAINFVRVNSLLFSVRGGGHNIAGNAVCEGGLMIDLSKMNSVKVDADKKRANVGPGAKLADFDGEAQKYSLAT